MGPFCPLFTKISIIEVPPTERRRRLEVMVDSLKVVVLLLLVGGTSIIDISVNNGQNGPIFHKETNRHTQDK